MTPTTAKRGIRQFRHPLRAICSSFVKRNLTFIVLHSSFIIPAAIIQTSLPTLQPEPIFTSVLPLTQDVHIALAFRTRDLDQAWDNLAVPYDVFLARPYMTALENHAPAGMHFAYVTFFDGDQAIGRAYFQIQHFDASEHIKTNPSEEKEVCFFTAISKWMRKWVSKRVKSDVLVCGNLLTTGEHHFQFLPNTVDALGINQLLGLAIEQIIEQSPRKISPFVLLKDVQPDRQHLTALLREQYTEFEIQPNMVLNVSWPDTAQYLAAMTTKYRTRYKRARKEQQKLRIERLTHAQLLDYKQDMYALYQSVATNVGFNMVDLHPGYIAGLQEALGAEFEVHAYYLEDKLVAYYTLIHNGDELDAHFIGFERSLNQTYQIYQNLLYDIVEHAINARKHRVVFARTALEIKSTVGATPEQLFCYLNHAGTLTNMITPHVVEYLKPVEVWQQRHPFKEEAGGE